MGERMTMESDRPVKVLILGAGKGGTALLELFTSTGVEVTGVADINPKAPGLRLARGLNIPTAADATALIASNGANLIVDVTGDPLMPARIADHKAADVESLGGTAARLLWTLVQREQDLRAQLIQAEKMATLGTFAAEVAHDFNNPLYCIREFAAFIQEEQDPAGMQDYAKEISKAVTYLSSVAQRLSQYARSGHGDKPASDLVHIPDLLDQAVTMARYSVSTDALEVVKDYGTVPAIRANSGELLQIFVNLVTNAVQAMNGRGRLTLTTATSQGVMTIAIQDTGSGISPANLERIFTPFFTTKGKKGTGLGLYIVQTLVKKYGGRIHVSSEEGNGTTFTIYFPDTSPPPL
ncbi:MAG TPA: HAMP domain-containing sensor histidine kinase [Nitrospiraceae bacterium]|nr:HAMP domain-containing sensor histidine kinase [Nitrospiraceae bacterium]